LFNQGTPIPISMQACDQPGSENKFMYSGLRSDNPLLTPEEAKQAGKFEESVKMTAISGSKLELSHEYRMTFDEVYETLFEDEQNDLNEILESEEELSLDDLFNATVDLYLEETTGISIMLPTECKLYTTADDYGTLITTSSPGGLITMSIYISPNETMEDGMQAMNSIKAFLETKGQTIHPEQDDINDFSEDDFNPYYSEYVENTTEDDNGDIQSEFFADLIISDGDFLAVTVNIADWSQVDNNPEERLYLYLLQTCALLSDFTIY